MDVLKVTQVCSSQQEFDARKRKGAQELLNGKKEKRFEKLMQEMYKDMLIRDKMAKDKSFTLRQVQAWNLAQLSYFDDGDIEKAKECAEETLSAITALEELYGHELWNV